MKAPVLVGIKHCGKSTLGKMLARYFSCPFVDSDEELEKRYAADHHASLSCREIYQRHGELFFRTLEAEVIHSLVSGEMRVLALGGGAVSNPYLSAADLKALGVIVWLDIADEIAFNRVIRHGLPPFLAEAEDPAMRFKEINDARRKSFSEIADYRFKIDRVLEKDDAVDQLAALLSKEKFQ